jgi:Ca-activated chloride channel family protein
MASHDITEQELTAYALSEITDAERIAAIERYIEQNADAAAQVQQVREQSEQLAAALGDAAPGELTEGHQQRIGQAKDKGQRPWVLRAAKPLAAAAAVLIVGGVAVAFMLPSLGSAPQSAVTMNDNSDNTSEGAKTPSNQSTSAMQLPPVKQPASDASRSQKLSNTEQPTPTAPQLSTSRQGQKAKVDSVSRTPRNSFTSSGFAAHGGARVQDTAVPRRPGGQDRVLTPSERNNPNFNTEQYAHLQDNPFRIVSQRPLSTFSVDVDTASYANVRRFLLRQSQMPPKDAVRIEEMINYFDYDYSPPSGNLDEGAAPFASHIEVAGCPWQPQHRLVRVGLKGWEPTEAREKPANLVFLLDVSGSMRSHRKLPLLKQAFGKLVDQLRPQDTVTIAVYAGASGLVLDATPASNKQKILDSLHRLQAGGSTNGGEGIKLAYKKATEHFVNDGINRVILATDGDFNVGVTDRGALTRLIEKKAKTGVYLSMLGFGTGNVKDDRMEQLSNKGDGNYAYIDSVREAEKVLVEQVAGTLRTIAKDVKLQVEFNPAQVQAYRLIGYANRILDKEDFNDDTKDAGDIGAGHTVTAFYQVVPKGAPLPGKLKGQHITKRIREVKTMLDAGNLTDEQRSAYEAELKKLKEKLAKLKGEQGDRSVDPLKYQQPKELTQPAKSGEMMTVKLRYKEPDEKKVQGTSELLTFPVRDSGAGFEDASTDFRFASSVAAFGMLLRDSEHKGQARYDDVLSWAKAASGDDAHGYRGQLLKLVRKAQSLTGRD